MILETKDVIQLLVLLGSAVGIVVKLQSDSKTQSNQHNELKSLTTNSINSINNKIDKMSDRINDMITNEKANNVQITSIIQRVDRVEKHVDRIGVKVFLGEETND